MIVQRKLEILADANLSRGVPQKKALPFIVSSDYSRHCERSEAIHRATKKEWIASRSLSSGGASRRPGGSQ